MEKFAAFARIAEIEFSDIVLSTQNLGNKLRIYLKDTSFIDFFFTTRLETQRFSMHWERRHINTGIYRMDNTPDKNWKKVKTFPLHFHNKIYENVGIPPFLVNKQDSLHAFFRRFLQFARENTI